ncbi:GNAT family N-acetyltransferase [Comamonas testosteroni]|uniref:GNAT family N-acetyltransferase n=1 Tax=Comamonas testosteroni TaxID=285 RepID=UPI00389A809F
MTITFEKAAERHLGEVLAWLEAEKSSAGGGFYCNRDVIARRFNQGSGICAFLNGSIVAFCVFWFHKLEAGIDIIEVHPQFRRQSIGSQLMSETVEQLRSMNARFIDVECTSQEGEVLCRANGFEDYTDPINYRSASDNPTLRRYLSDWRPEVKPYWYMS